MVKVRFAPSPTGNLHIGGARTALFNWMYARSQKGTFVLRIEDTDQVRSKKEYEEEILRSMKWLGLDWDEVYYQSDRFDLYREYADKLIEEGKAYKDGDAVLLKMTVQEVKIYDIIRGEISFDTTNFIQRNDDGKPILDDDGNEKLRDEVLIKSDGSPAYSFCCAIDDALMEITHVVRGEDHISNTPKQILIYQALGFKPPKYAHLPLIMGEDGSRLSKRFGAVAVSDYKKNGFLSGALVNYLMLLGWSPGNNQEIITLDNAVKKFSLKKVNNSAAIFAMDKLKWVNGEYLKEKPAKEVFLLLKEMLEEGGFINKEIDLLWVE
ncbi:MAG: glutamyl/glutaminyl-tRNA synthetase, partial [Lysobacterales bacterium]